MRCKPIHPKYMKVGQYVFDRWGEKIELLHIVNKAGVWEITGSRENGLFSITWDSHNYGGLGPELPKLYKKNPKRRNK